MKDIATAKRLIEEDKQARGHKCIEKIQDVLKQMNCDLTIVYSIIDNQPKGSIQVVALDEQPPTSREVEHVGTRPNDRNK